MDHTQTIQLEQDGATVRLTITVPKEEIQAAEQHLQEEIRQAVDIPGFRPGKAPLHLALARYGQDAFEAELKERLVEGWLHKAIQEHALRPATNPQVDISDFQPGESLTFEASFEAFPQADVPDTPDVDIPEPPSPEVSEEEIDDVLQDLQRRSAALKPRDGPAAAGDVVRIGRGGHTWEAEVDPEGALGNQLMGAQAGQDITIEHEGTEETFTVEGIYEVILPEPEEVAQQYGKESWDELREEVRDELLKQAESDAEHRRRSAALDAMADTLGLEPPPKMLAEVVEGELKRFGGKEELREEVEKAVRRRLRRELIARMICEQKGLLPEEDEVTAQAEESKQDADAVRARLLSERAADWVLNNQQRRDA